MAFSGRRSLWRYGLVQSQPKTGEAGKGGTSQGHDGERETEGPSGDIAGEVRQIQHLPLGPSQQCQARIYSGRTNG